jgi:sulfotransferase
MKPILQNYYSTVDRPVVFDKSRGWCGYLELAEHCLDKKVKVIVPVRKIVDILASFEKLTRINSPEWQMPQEKTHFFEMQTLAGRADVWMRNDQPVGIAYNRIRDALDRGYGPQMHFIEFENLTIDPEATMKALYDFLGEVYFPHDFSNVEQTTSENDDIHGIPGLHTIRSEVKPFIVDAEKIIGPDAFKKYSNAEFWRVTK